MKKKSFVVVIEYPEKSREITLGVIEDALESFLDSTSGFYYECIDIYKGGLIKTNKNAVSKL